MDPKDITINITVKANADFEALEESHRELVGLLVKVAAEVKKADALMNKIRKSALKEKVGR